MLSQFLCRKREGSSAWCSALFAESCGGNTQGSGASGSDSEPLNNFIDRFCSVQLTGHTSAVCMTAAAEQRASSLWLIPAGTQHSGFEPASFVKHTLRILDELQAFSSPGWNLGAFNVNGSCAVHSQSRTSSWWNSTRQNSWHWQMLLEWQVWINFSRINR